MSLFLKPNSMSRTYALALIFTALTLIGGAFYGQYRYFTDGQAEAYAYAAGVHERVVEGQLAEMKELAHLANERMEEDSKYRFRPILPFVKKAFRGRDAYLEKVEKERSKAAYDMVAFSRFHEKQLVSLSLAYGSFLKEFGHTMDLNERDVEIKLLNVEKIVNRFLSANAPVPQTALTPRLLALDYLEVVRRVVRDVVETSGGRAIICNLGPTHFPILSMNVENPRKGEQVLAKVSVGSYFSELKPENIVLLIDNDTIEINNYGVADYSFTPSKRGKLKLDIELGIINPLTGEVRRNETTKVFNIR